jgi:hypothetical protein
LGRFVKKDKMGVNRVGFPNKISISSREGLNLKYRVQNSSINLLKCRKDEPRMPPILKRENSTE